MKKKETSIKAINKRAINRAMKESDNELNEEVENNPVV